MKQLLIILAIVILCASCSVLCKKKNNFKQTGWECVTEEFVADAGTMTITFSLKFISAKDYIFETTMYMPAHPNMYMNADGTVDINPATSSNWSEKGTYTVKDNVIILTNENGEKHGLEYVAGNLVSSDLSYKTITLTRK